MFHASEFSDDPLSFISESETLSGRDPWYTWPENRHADSWKFVAVPVLAVHRIVDFDIDHFKLPGVYESILRSSVPKVSTWDSLTLTGERQRIVWKFWGMENILCWDQKFSALNHIYTKLINFHECLIHTWLRIGAVILHVVNGHLPWELNSFGSSSPFVHPI